jgi:hypothetical protein
VKASKAATVGKNFKVELIERISRILRVLLFELVVVCGTDGHGGRSGK